MSLKPAEFKTLFLSLSPHELQPQQDILIDKLIAFLYAAHENPLFVLQGYAGTGKTTLLGTLVKTLDHIKYKSVLLAPTGRAAKVLSLRASKPAITIHKKIYYTTTDASGYSSVQIIPNLHRNTIFIIDEASMIADYASNGNQINSRNLLEDLITYVFTGFNCKLIFLGDRGQLPPVGSDESPALDSNYLKNHFPMCTIELYEMTEVIRQAQDSDILFNATSLRNQVSGVIPKMVVRGKGDVERVNGNEVIEFLENSYSKYGKDNTIVITRSNKEANTYNCHIRNQLLGYEEEVSSGDLLMIVSNNYYWLKPENSDVGFIANGEMIRVNRVGKQEELYGFRFLNISASLVDYEDHPEIDVKIMLNTLMYETPNLPREKQKELFYEIEKDFSQIGNKQARHQQIMKSPHFNALQVKYGYAVTCHKSQGGQWESVFVDQGYLTEEMVQSNYLRWLYTGVTRASEKLHLVNFNDFFFDEEN